MQTSPHIKLSLIATSVLLSLVALDLAVPLAAAAPKSFASCLTLKKTYPAGIAKNKSVKNVGGMLARMPLINSSLYGANKKLDLDKDGIVCEVLKSSDKAVGPRPTPALAPLSLDNLDLKRIRASGASEVIRALQQNLSVSPEVNLVYNISPTVPEAGEAQAKLQISEAAKLFSRLFRGQTVRVEMVTEKEDSQGYRPGNPFTCGGQAWWDFRMKVCLPTTGNYMIENPGIPFHEFVHIAQYTQNARTSNFFMEGTATYISAVVGQARDGTANDNLDNWLNRADSWRATYENLGFKYTAEDMAKFLDLADSDSSYENRFIYHAASFKLGSAMWEAMIAVYGWEKFMEFMASLGNGKTYGANFEAAYSITLQTAHAKLAAYLISISWK